MDTKTDNAAEVGMHVFEKAGLGKAPFRFVGCAEVVYRAHPDAPAQPGGSCDYCGTAITLHCYIKSADGKRFKVGCDCVRKTGDAGLMRAYKNHPDVRKLNREKTKAKAARVVSEWNALISDEANRAKLAALPSGNTISANKLESFEWIWKQCGAAGKAKWLKILKQTLDNVKVATRELETT